MTLFPKEDAYKMVRPCLNPEATEDSVWAVLDLAYDNPDQRGTAKRELKRLTQANWEFSTYFAEFQMIQANLIGISRPKEPPFLMGSITRYRISC